jgi:ATP-binding cassette subfamily B multidrug efflux pump
MSERKNTANQPKGRHRGPGAGPIGFDKPKNLKTTFLRILGYLLESKWMVAAVVIALLLNSASMLAGTYFLKPLINNYIIPKDFRGLAFALAGLGAVYLVGIVAAYLQMRLNFKVAQKTVNRIRRDLFDKMQDLEVRYFDTHTHGELMSRFTNDVDNIQLMLEQSVAQLISSVLTFVGVIVLMIVLSPILFVAAALVMVLMIFLSMKIGGKSHSHFKSQQQTLGELNGYIEEIISGLKEVKVFNHEEAVKQSFYELNEKYRTTAAKASFLAGILMPIMANMNNVNYAVIAVFGGFLTVAGLFDIGSLAAFLQYSRHVMHPITQITGQINNILAAMAGAERVFEIMDQKPEVDEGSIDLVVVKKAEDGTLVKAGENERTGMWAWYIPEKDELVPLRGMCGSTM